MSWAISSSLKLEGYRGKWKCPFHTDFLLQLRKRKITSSFLHILQPRTALDTYRNVSRGWELAREKQSFWCVSTEDAPVNGGLLPLSAHPMPSCHPTGTPTDHPLKVKRQSCGLFTSESSSAGQSGLQKCGVLFTAGSGCSYQTPLCAI